MGNCYGCQQQDSPNYVDKNVRVQRKISAEVSISKSDKKMGLDTNLAGVLTTVRQETYHIPRVLDLVHRETQTENQLFKNKSLE